MAPMTSTLTQTGQLYPIDRKTGLFSCFAFSNASSPHGYHCTGLYACCKRYGDFSLINLLGVLFRLSTEPPPFFSLKKEDIFVGANISSLDKWELFFLVRFSLFVVNYTGPLPFTRDVFLRVFSHQAINGFIFLMHSSSGPIKSFAFSNSLARSCC